MLGGTIQIVQFLNKGLVAMDLILAAVWWLVMAVRQPAPTAGHRFRGVVFLLFFFWSIVIYGMSVPMH